MYVWSSVAHMALPLGEAGISQMSNEKPLLDSMQSTLGAKAGLYLFPAMAPGEDMQKYQQRLAASPSGLLVYRGPGAAALTPAKLAIEFFTEMAEALLLAWLISRTMLKTFAAKVTFAAVVGLVAACATNIPYWNWYDFPGSYTAAYMLTQFVGFVLAGMAAAKMLREPL